MNASKQKGTAFESAVRNYLRWALCDQKIDRAALHGTDDIGDIIGVFHGNTPVVIECKSRKRPQAYEALSEAVQEAENLGKIVGGTCLPAAVVHLPGIGIKSLQRVGQQLVVLPYDVLPYTYMHGAPRDTAITSHKIYDGTYTYMHGAPSDTSYSAIYKSTPARLRTYRDVEITIMRKNDNMVCGWAAELPGDDRLVDITCLRDFAIALNGLKPIGGANVR